MPQFQLVKMWLLFAVALLSTLGMSHAMAADMPAGGKVEPLVMVSEEKGASRIRPMTDAEQTSAMCVVGATAGMTAAYVAGPSEVILLIVGGMVVPSSSSVLFLGLFGTIAAAGCTIGTLATPATSWLYHHFSDR
ncbi:conserved membrane hypothetical protein [Gammaproteobacteria bacterium]